MYAHTVNYLKRDGRRPSHKERVSRGFWVRVPRPLLLCTVAGHKPVVQGTEGFRDQPGHRWVACARCGVRPEAQGHLDPAHWDIGRRYTGAWTDQAQHGITTKGDPVDPTDTGPDRDRTWTVPGPWPGRQTGTIGGQLVIGTQRPALGFSFKVGNAGSEHVLAGDVSLPFLGTLYLHTESIGKGIQQRLNPTGYESKVTELEVGSSGFDHRLSWKVWANRNEHTKDTPRWRDGSLNLDMVERLLGPARYSYTRQGGPMPGVVRMPEGDDHQVRLTLKRQTLARSRPANRRPLEEKWTVEWSSKAGIPFRRDSWKGDSCYGSSVYVSDQAVTENRWVQEACAAIAQKIAADRTSYRWRPAEPKASTQNGSCGVATYDVPVPTDETSTDLGMISTLPPGYAAGLPSKLHGYLDGALQQEGGYEVLPPSLTGRIVHVIDVDTVSPIPDFDTWATEECRKALEKGADQIVVYTNHGRFLLDLVLNTWCAMVAGGLAPAGSVVITEAVHTRPSVDPESPAPARGGE
jgi:hypothetical protein